MKTFSWLSPITSKVLRACLTIAMVAFWTACTDNNVIGPDDQASGAHWLRRVLLDGNPKMHDGYCSGLGIATDNINWVGLNAPENYDGWDKPIWSNVMTVEVSNGGRDLKWTAAPGICIKAIIVKGGDAGYIYYYDGTVTEDSGLQSPGKSTGKNKTSIPAISHISVCYTVCDDPCYKDETAWAAGTRYQKPGNWATFTAYGANATVDLFAGQTFHAGKVNFSAIDGNGDVTITITLESGFRFDPDTDESVKIQGYDTPQSGYNPNPGGFANKGDAKSSPFSIVVKHSNFYGVHVDVERKVACPQ